MKLNLPIFVILFCFINTACLNAQQEKSSSINAGLTLPAGFKAMKVADGLGAARHLAVTPNGRYIC